VHDAKGLLKIWGSPSIPMGCTESTQDNAIEKECNSAKNSIRIVT
jgi:hypothetical protein